LWGNIFLYLSYIKNFLFVFFLIVLEIVNKNPILIAPPKQKKFGH